MFQPTPSTLKPLIPAWMDDAGWTVAEFRVYSHLCRREGVKGYAYPSIQSISENCRLHKDTVCRCLKALEGRGYLKRVRKGGRSNRYFLFTAADVFATTQLPLAETEGRLSTGTKGQVVPETEGQEGIERKESKEGVGDTAPSSVASESEPEWRQRLQAAYPDIDIAAEIKKATRKKPSFERGWFERSWLPRCTPVVGRRDYASEQAADKLIYAEHCDEGLAWFLTSYPGSDCVTWPDVPFDQRKRYAREIIAKIQVNAETSPVLPKKT